MNEILTLIAKQLHWAKNSLPRYWVQTICILRALLSVWSHGPCLTLLSCREKFDETQRLARKIKKQIDEPITS